MEDTSSLKEVGKYAVVVGGAAALANPIVGGTVLIVGGAAYVAAGVIDHFNSSDNSRHADESTAA